MRDLIIKAIRSHITESLETDASSIVYFNQTSIKINEKFYEIDPTLLTTILKTIVNRNYVTE